MFVFYCIVSLYRITEPSSASLTAPSIVFTYCTVTVSHHHVAARLIQA